MVAAARHPPVSFDHLVPWKMKPWMQVIGLLFFAGSPAQEPAGMEQIARELIENGQPGEAEELYATVRSHLDHPVDLNNSSREELVATGIFTPFQAFVIVDQRDRYGPFFSIYELAAIPGINREFLEQIREMVTFSSGVLPGPSPNTGGMLLTNVAVRLPCQYGMQQPLSGDRVYRGNILKLTQRISMDYGDKLSLGVAFDKDAGEAWTNRGRPEHLTGYLSLTPGKTIRKLVIGNFRIHRGMGLVHKMGFSSRGTGNPLNSYARSYGKPFASTLEYSYFRGIYGEAALGKWTLDLFASHQPVDISFHRRQEKQDLFEMTRQTGLHRSTGERDGFDLARLSAAGGSINRSGQHFYAGISATVGRMQLTETGMDSLRSIDPMRARHAAISMYSVVFGSTCEVYGEMALDQTLHGAFLLGGTLVINPALSGEASLERKSPGFRGMRAGPVSDEEDVYDLQLGCRMTPFRHARLRLYHEIQMVSPVSPAAGPRFPERYGIVEFIYKNRNGPEIKLKYTGKTVQELLTFSQPGNGVYQDNSTRHLRIHYRWEPNGKIILQGRLEFSAFRTDGSSVGSASPATVCLSGSSTNGLSAAIGSMAYQQVQLLPRDGIRITYRLLLFHVDDWENRIYTYEPGVRYSFLFPSWYGTGSRNVLVLSAKMGQRITLRGKCGLTQYAHRWQSGSGNDQRNGNRLFDAELQLQVNLY